MIEWADHLFGAFDALGPLGYVLFVAAYVVAVLFLFPEALFTLIAGALFGALLGSLIAWLCAMTGAFAAFLLSRTALRGRLEKRFEKHKVLRAVNRALPKEGWKVVALARLTLVPFGWQNYLFGVTKVHGRDYLVATGLAIVPGTVIAAFVGSNGRALLGGGNGWNWALVAGGIVASIALSILLGRIAKKRLGL